MKGVTQAVLPGVAGALVLGGCASLSPAEQGAYTQAQAQVRQLSSEPLAPQAAGQPLAQARQDLTNAEAAAQAHDTGLMRYWSYLAMREAQIGEAQVEEYRAHMQLEQAAASRDQLLIDFERQRTRLAELAASQAERQIDDLARQLAQLRTQQQLTQQRELAQLRLDAQQLRVAQRAARQARSQVQLSQQQTREQVAQAQARAEQAQRQLAQLQAQADQQIQRAQQQAQQARNQLAALQAHAEAAPAAAPPAVPQSPQGAGATVAPGAVASEGNAGPAEHTPGATPPAGAASDDATALTLGSPILFEPDSATLEPGARDSLKKVASYLQQHPQMKLRVEAFTTTQPGNGPALLAQQRATAVMQALEADGIAASRLQALGTPVPPLTADAAAGEGAQNQRVLLHFSNPTGQFASNENDTKPLR
jgi:outer membrane protein OmpA-like peptidoglycan-associated protein